jgi:hypothetical protein
MVSDPDPTPDPTYFFSDFKDEKKKKNSIFFSYNLPACRPGTLTSVLKIVLLLKLFRSNPILQALLQKGEESGAGSGSWRPKNMRLLRIRIRIPNTAAYSKTLYFSDLD